jgi:hypothetical protein
MTGPPRRQRLGPVTRGTIKLDPHHKVTQDLSGRHRLLVECPTGWRYDAIDPSDVAEVLAEIHGGRRRAAHWLRAVLAEVTS